MYFHNFVSRTWIVLSFVFRFTVSYDATWESLDARPLPSWYDESKFGIFIHWGVFSVPAFGSEWFWYNWKHNKDEYQAFVNRTERPGFTYPEYASRFDAALYNPDAWASIFAKSGAQYVVLTSKHHDGYCNWDSKRVPTTWNWNCMDVGPHVDLVGGLAKSIKATTSPFTHSKLHFGLYHSLLEWFHPAYLQDKANNFTTTTFVDTKTMPELYNLVQQYEPELIWSDGDWETSSHYWKATEFLAWYATHSPVAATAVWNDRWGTDSTCQHGSYVTCQDRYTPGKYQERKWENALTVDATSWGFNRNSSSYYSTEYLIHMLIQTVAFHGNMLLNIGPSADGTISPIFVDRLKGMGEWLRVNGEAIYATTPWKVQQNETSTLYYTTRPDTKTLNAIATTWPSKNRLVLHTPQAMFNITTVTMLGYNKQYLDWKPLNKKRGMIIKLPPLTPNVIPCQHAWVFCIRGIGNFDSTEVMSGESKVA
jgi:alpha-L-fucosidase